MVFVPYGAILIAFILIQIPRAVVGAEMKKLAGGYDNSDPRGQQTKLEGRGKRALNAHHNSIEAFPGFAVAVLCCAQTPTNLTYVAIACIVFIVARVVYISAYLADKSTFRSTMWSLGMVATGALFIMSLVALR
jgi:uncharacterized MAPEG superfamily protein